MSTESEYLWVSESFDSNLCQNYFFYGILEANRITVCVVDESQAELKALQEIEGRDFLNSSANVEAALNKIKFINNDYRQLKMAIHSERNCLLPTSLPTKLEKLASIEITPPTDSESWLNENVISGKFNLLGIINKSVELVLEQTMPNLKTNNLASTFLEEEQKLTRFHKKGSCRWLISKNASYICIFKERKLMFFNYFNISNTEDLIYYTLNVFEQLEIEANDIDIAISGQLKFIDFNEKLAMEYLPNTNVFRELQGLKTEYLNDAAISRNFTLLNMFLCE